MNRAVLICHCLLDPLTRAVGTKEIKRDIIKALIDSDISIVQLPCPEMTYGFFRLPSNKEDYDTVEYRNHCKRLAEEIARTVEKYENAGFDIIGLISVGGSPSCGFLRTHVRGEHARESGVFMEELQKILRKKNMQLKICDHELLEDRKEREQFLLPEK